jgi:MFS family permease
MVSRLFMGWMIHTLGRGKVLMGSMLVAGVAMVALPFLHEPLILVFLMLVLGVGLGLGQPMTIAWVANRASRDQRGTALAVRLTGNRLAQLVVPSLMGALAGGLLAGAGMVSRTPLDDPVPAPQPPPDEVAGAVE